MPLHVLQPSRAPRARDGDIRQVLAEGAAVAGRIAAVQASQAHAQTDGPPLPGQGGEAALRESRGLRSDAFGRPDSMMSPIAARPQPSHARARRRPR